MDNNAKHEKSERIASVLAAALVIALMLVVLSSIIVVARYAEFSATDKIDYIELSGADTSSKCVDLAGRIFPGMIAFADDGAFTASDDKQVWTSETDVEIFSARYDNNGDLIYTVESANGNKVVAPGTTQTYRFSLKNTKTRSVDYTLTIEAYVEGTEQVIPVVVRLSGDDGYVLGATDNWIDFYGLDGYAEKGVLASGRVSNYKLEWQWPFERGTGSERAANDSFDTMLGNLAVDRDLVLHVIIKTAASYDEDPSHPGGEKTGDEYSLKTWSIVWCVCILSAIFLIVEKSKLDKLERGMRDGD